MISFFTISVCFTTYSCLMSNNFHNVPYCNIVIRLQQNATEKKKSQKDEKHTCFGKGEY